MNDPVDHSPDVPAPLLSVIVPVYNEERTLDELLRRVVAGPYPYPAKEIIVVDDGSQDQTAAILQRWAGQPGIVLLRHPHNRGKGAAVRTGLAVARGEITLIQDADLEYDPTDYTCLVERICRGDSDAVYGSRYLRLDTALPWSKFRVAGHGLSLLVRLLFGQRLTDEATCYKAVRAQLLRAQDLQAEGFDLCAEITAKLCRAGARIVEVPISYRPRSATDGKKIGWKDVWPTLRALFKWRFLRLPIACRNGPPALQSQTLPVPSATCYAPGAATVEVPSRGG